jgi:hypothetical protein
MWRWFVFNYIPYLVPADLITHP